MTDPLLPDDGGDDDRTEELSVDEQITHDRLRAIKDARNTVEKVRLRGRVRAARRSSPITQQGARILYHEALKNYLQNLRPYRDVGGEAGRLWYGYDRETGSDRQLIGAEKLPDGQTLVLRSLEDVLELDATIQVTTTTMVDYPQGPPQELENTESYALSRQTLDEAFGWANDFARTLGLDLDVDAEERRAQGEYSDLFDQ